MLSSLFLSVVPALLAVPLLVVLIVLKVRGVAVQEDVTVVVEAVEDPEPV